MSTTQNTQWLEAATDNFEDALGQGNWSLCESIIADVRDAGFESDQATMQLRYTHERFHDR